MPRIRQDLADHQARDGFVTVAEASRRSGVCERTIRSWTRNGTVVVRRVGPLLVFVDAASLAVATGGSSGETDEEILADLAADTPDHATAQPAPHPRPLRELTIHRDEESQ